MGESRQGIDDVQLLFQPGLGGMGLFGAGFGGGCLLGRGLLRAFGLPGFPASLGPGFLRELLGKGLWGIFKLSLPFPAGGADPPGAAPPPRCRRGGSGSGWGPDA